MKKKTFETQIANSLAGHRTLIARYIPEKYCDQFINGFILKSVQWSGQENIQNIKWVGVDCKVGFYLYPVLENNESEIRAKTCYDFIQVSAETFGFSLSVVCTNHFAWHLDSQKDTDLETIRKINDQFYAVRNLGFDDKLENVDPASSIQILD